MNAIVRRQKWRVIAFLIAVVMVFTLMPTGAVFASDTAAPTLTPGAQVKVAPDDQSGVVNGGVTIMHTPSTGATFTVDANGQVVGSLPTATAASWYRNGVIAGYGDYVTFGGWFTARYGKGLRIDGYEYRLFQPENEAFFEYSTFHMNRGEKRIMLYAYWRGDTVRVYFDPNHTYPDPKEQKLSLKNKRYKKFQHRDYRLLEPPEPLPVPKRRGYTFKWWDYECVAMRPGYLGFYNERPAVRILSVHNGDEWTLLYNGKKVNGRYETILYAHWTPNKYKLQFDVRGGKLAQSKRSKTVTFGKKYGKLSTPSKKGYKFNGWFTKKSGGKKITSAALVKTAKNQTLYARWRKV